MLFFKNGLYFEISHTSGRLVQLARTLPSHGRGHRFESCSAHHPSLGGAELRMASHHFRPKGGNGECRHRTRRGRMSSLARSASEDGRSRKLVQRMTFGAELRMASHHFRPKGGNGECRHRTRRGRMSPLARSASEDGSAKVFRNQWSSYVLHLHTPFFIPSSRALHRQYRRFEVAFD